MLDAVENFKDIIYIKDKVLNTIHNLFKSSFKPNLAPGTYLDRFSIVFGTSALNNAEVVLGKDLKVFYNENKVMIYNKNGVQLSDVKIFNTVGQKIIELHNSELNQQKITIPFFRQKGLYVILIESGRSKKTFKIIN